jgi:hypothetical protein
MLSVLLIGSGLVGGAHVANLYARRRQVEVQAADNNTAAPFSDRPRDINRILHSPEYLRGELRYVESIPWAAGRQRHEYINPVTGQRIYQISDKPPYFGHGEGYQ